MNKKNLPPAFENMLNFAKAYFNQSFDEKYEYHQCLVIKTADGKENLYPFTCNSVRELIDQSISMLHKENITTVTNIICMWKGGTVDVPSHQFVKKLCEINPENKNAEILLNSSPTSYTYTTKKISDILK